jgi:hypothetical protein
MNRKFLIRLAPLAVIAAFAVVPSAASALSWTSNGSPVSETTTVIGWGTLTLTGAAGNITCHNSAAGTVSPGGLGSTQVFVTYDCESTTCPAENSATALGLPWPSHLIAGGPTGIRSQTEKIKVTILCTTEAGKKILGGGTFFGTNEPSVHKGASALHPGFVEFDAGSGELELEPAGSKVKGKTEGEAKTLGYEEQELINAK